MKTRIIVLASLAVTAGWAFAGAVPNAFAAPTGAYMARGTPAAQAGTAKQPQWKSREEYDAFQAIVSKKDPTQMVTAADAFLQKYPNSDFKDQADLAKMQAYQQLNQSDKAMDAARQSLQANPANLGALNYLCFAMPFVYKPTDANKDTELADLDSYAKKGLEVLGQQQKPANMSDDQFKQQINQLRANFNGAEGFAALQKKDYAASITAFNEAKQDNASDPFTFYRLGLAYLNSSPPDYDHAIWNLARASVLAKTAKTTDAAAIEKFYQQVYQSRHGSDAGENDVETQAATTSDPPADFKVAQAAKHAPTGNQFIDAFYSYEDNLKVGGDTETNTWNQIKGQNFGGPGWVDGDVEKAPDGSYLVHIDITNDSKNKNGVYDIELKDSQPGCKDLSQGDPVRFSGAISAYTATPSFVLTLSNGNINEDDLKAAAAEKEQKKPTRTTHHRSSSQGH